MTNRLFRQWMKKLDLNYSVVARRCGCSRQAVHQWFNSGSLRIDTLENAVKNGLGLSLKEFYSLDLTGSEDEDTIDGSSYSSASS